MEQRQLARRLHAEGRSLREIGAELACSHEAVRLILRCEGTQRACSMDWRPQTGRLTIGEREEISLGLHRGETFTAIAARLERSVSTVSREVGANGGRGGYRAWRAHLRAREQTRRPKSAKLGLSPPGTSG